MAASVILTHADGTAITAQEAYDAFMNTRVIIVINENTYEAINMVWYDNNSAQTDPTNVGYVELIYVYDGSEGPTLSEIVVGDSSLIP